MTIPSTSGSLTPLAKGGLSTVSLPQFSYHISDFMSFHQDSVSKANNSDSKFLDILIIPFSVKFSIKSVIFIFYHTLL